MANEKGKRGTSDERERESGMIVGKRNPVSDSDLAEKRGEVDREKGETERKAGKEDTIRRNARRHPLGRLAMTGYAIHTLRQMQFH